MHAIADRGFVLPAKYAKDTKERFLPQRAQRARRQLWPLDARVIQVCSVFSVRSVVKKSQVHLRLSVFICGCYFLVLAGGSRICSAREIHERYEKKRIFPRITRMGANGASFPRNKRKIRKKDFYHREHRGHGDKLWQLDDRDFQACSVFSVTSVVKFL